MLRNQGVGYFYKQFVFVKKYFNENNGHIVYSALLQIRDSIYFLSTLQA